MGYVVTLCLIFEELPECFLKLVYHFTPPPAVYEGSTTSPIFVTIYLLIIVSPSWWEAVCHCGLDLISMIASGVENLSVCSSLHFAHVVSFRTNYVFVEGVETQYG